MKEESKLKKKRIDWIQYESPNLDLTTRRKAQPREYRGCASSALGIITGIHPKTIEKKFKKIEKGVSTATTIRFLRKKGYKVIELTKQDVLKVYWEQFPINERHLLLINGSVDSESNSMFVLHGGRVWHNYDVMDNSALFFINKPTQDVLLVSHKKWKQR